MTQKERAAMQQALEALHNVGNALICLTATRNLRPMHVEMRDDAVNRANEAFTAMREALAEQALQNLSDFHQMVEQPKQQGEAVAWEYLTDEDRAAAFNSLPDMLDGFLKRWGWLHFANEIERRCMEKQGIFKEANE